MHECTHAQIHTHRYRHTHTHTHTHTLTDTADNKTYKRTAIKDSTILLQVGINEITVIMTEAIVDHVTDHYTNYYPTSQ